MTRFAIALVALFAFTLVGCGSPDAPAADAPAANDAVSEWTDVVQFTGESIKETESFVIDEGEWRINWETTADAGAGIFTFDILKDEGEFVTVGGLSQGAGSDTTNQRGSGDYYLSINTTQPYTITVQQK